MKRALLVVLLGACLGAGTPPAAARTCAVDVVPAATLLLPYFEVDLANASGRTTLFSVSNASDRGILAHVVLWTDLGVPTLAFDVYLTGYDVQTINLRDVFAGQLPRTASDGQDPQDTISPQGEFSQDINYANCTGLMPPPPLQANFVDHLRRAHRGLASPLLNGSCAGVPHADQVARGYVTVDVVKQCTTLTPADGGYFGPEGVAANDNLLWGDFFLIDPAGNLAQGENLVRLESDPARFAGKPTFYERYVNGTGADGREPLPTVWASRYINGGAFTGGTDLIYWRDSRQRNQAFQCNLPPVWYPIRLEEGHSFVFDEQENADSPVCPFPSVGGCFFPFPGESGRVAVNGPALPSPFNFGWWYFDMKTEAATGFVYSQAWMGTLHDAQGRFSVGYEAEPFDSGCAPRTSNPGSN
ncbi:MAG TPA: hypothetical protein VG477_03060 [Thermoanaerobaculia bacterium]|nr:hypothetical protein [Thermoanaerobaculia bacterium]